MREPWSSSDAHSRGARWDERRRQLLEDRRLTLDKLVRRRRSARWMKYPVWLGPLALVMVAVDAVGGAFSWSTTIAAALICYGGVASFRLGRVWESRWDQLIREKAARGL